LIAKKKSTFPEFAVPSALQFRLKMNSAYPTGNRVVIFFYDI
jgi:hypothetical protein